MTFEQMGRLGAKTFAAGLMMRPKTIRFPRPKGAQVGYSFRTPDNAVYTFDWQIHSQEFPGGERRAVTEAASLLAAHAKATIYLTDRADSAHSQAYALPETRM